VRNQPRTVNYPFTLIGIRLDKNGEGEGKAVTAPQIQYDEKNAISWKLLDRARAAAERQGREVMNQR